MKKFYLSGSGRFAAHYTICLALVVIDDGSDTSLTVKGLSWQAVRPPPLSLFCPLLKITLGNL